ncbi:MAG: hypothetical protein J6X38_07470 [Abditibacteriota bacterium]|nr:hypothetical protein [Abditibacteriota bacterium]
MKKILFLIIIILISTICHARDAFFPVTFWCSPADFTEERFAEMAECGINVVYCQTLGQKETLDLCARHNMKVIVTDPRIFAKDASDPDFEENLRSVVKDYGSHPALWGYLVKDEPYNDSFDKIAAVTKCLHRLDKKHPAHTNLYGDDPRWNGSHKDYVEEYCRKARPRVVSCDLYPFTADPAGDRIDFWFDNLATFRDVSLRYNIPFGIVVQATRHRWYDIPAWNFREAGEGELRWQVYTALAYGAKGLGYFTYYTPGENRWTEYGEGIINRDYSRNPKYDIVKRINAEVRAMAPILLGCKSVSVVRDDVKKVLVGELRSKSGKKYMMIVNTNYEKENHVMIDFPNRVKIEVINPRGAKPVISPMCFEKTLMPGDGVLIRVKQ